MHEWTGDLEDQAQLRTGDGYGAVVECLGPREWHAHVWRSGYDGRRVTVLETTGDDLLPLTGDAARALSLMAIGADRDEHRRSGPQR